MNPIQTVYIQHKQQAIAVNVRVDKYGQVRVASVEPVNDNEIPATEAVAFVYQGGQDA